MSCNAGNEVVTGLGVSAMRRVACTPALARRRPASSLVCGCFPEPSAMSMHVTHGGPRLEREGNGVVIAFPCTTSMPLNEGGITPQAHRITGPIYGQGPRP